MTKAFQQIVDIYVRYKNLARLGELKSQRQKLLFDIRTRSSELYDQSKLVQQIDEEIKMIDAGLEKLASD